jgi:rhodanese-related sulfurtransferase
MPRRLRISTEEMIAAAKSRIENLSVEEFESIRGDAGALILDIRDVRELERDGTVPGAVHVPRGLLEFWADPDSHHYKDVFDDAETIVLFCAGGGRSALAADALSTMGYPDVRHLEAGFSGWVASGKEPEPRQPRAHRTP